MIALLRFHLASGARVALIAGVPLAGAATVAIGLQPYPGRSVELIARAIAGSPPSYPAIGGLAALAYALALWAAPRVTLGSDGWVRHLPVSRAQHRVALIAATACAEAPLLLAALGGAVLMSCRTGAVAWRGFLVPPVLAVTAAALAIGAGPARRRANRLHRMPFRVPFDLYIAWRAVGARVATGWLAGAIPLGAAFLFVNNNVLTAPDARCGVRLGGALAVTFALASSADVLAILRPSWPWARSLPWSARRRVAGDALWLGAICAPIVLATAALDVYAAATVLTLTPLLALRAAGAMRRGGAGRSVAAGPVLIEGAFASGLIALIPWLGVLALAAMPLALRAAIEREHALKVTRWSALHHVASGDTLSWTQ